MTGLEVNDDVRRDVHERAIVQGLVPWLRLAGLSGPADRLVALDPSWPGVVLKALEDTAEDAFAARSMGPLVSQLADLKVELVERLAGYGLSAETLDAVWLRVELALMESYVNYRVVASRRIMSLEPAIRAVWADPEGVASVDTVSDLANIGVLVDRGACGLAVREVDVDALTVAVRDAVRANPDMPVAVAQAAAERFFGINRVCAVPDVEDLAEETDRVVEELAALVVPVEPQVVSPTHRVEVTDLVTGEVVYSVEHTVTDTEGMNVHEGRVEGRVSDHEVALWFSSPDVCPFDCDSCRT